MAKKPSNGKRAARKGSPTKLFNPTNVGKGPGTEKWGQGGELHQTVESEESTLTTQQGIPVADDQNTLRIGASSSSRRKVWTPNPSMNRNERGIARSDMTHMIMCMLSGVSVMKSQNVSWADCAWGNTRSGSGFTAWICRET
jgi:hypothetical protein